MRRMFHFEGRWCTVVYKPFFWRFQIFWRRSLDFCADGLKPEREGMHFYENIDIGYYTGSRSVAYGWIFLRV